VVLDFGWQIGQHMHKSEVVSNPYY